MIRWLLALLVWVACLLLLSWYLLPDARNGLYVLVFLTMVGFSVPIVRGIIREAEKVNEL